MKEFSKPERSIMDDEGGEKERESISINGVEFDFYHVNKQSTVFFSLTMNTTRHFLNPSGWITFALLSFRFKQMFHWRKSAKKFFFLADVALVGSILTTPVFYSETPYEPVSQLSSLIYLEIAPLPEQLEKK